MNRRRAGGGWATELPDMDFETFSEAGYLKGPDGRWRKIQKNAKSGLSAVGADVYARHPSTEVLCLAYDLKDGRGRRLWTPDDPSPEDLFAHIHAGGLIEAHNSGFEYLIWKHVCVPKLGWPELPLEQLRCSAAKARSFGIPGALKNAGQALGVANLKIEDGTRLLNKFSVPRTPTKNDPRERIFPHEDPDGAKLYEYCLGDIAAEADISARCPDLAPSELEIWQTDQRINMRGVAVDVVACENFWKIVQATIARGERELSRITSGSVQSAGELEKIKDWCSGRGVEFDNLTKDDVELYLTDDLLPPDIRQVLELRAALNSASVKKLPAILRRAADGRVRDLFMYCGAERTGRWAGMGAQPQNLKSGGPKVRRCSCGAHYGLSKSTCPWCGAGDGAPVGWCHEAVLDAIRAAESGDLAVFEWHFDDPLVTIGGCLRAMFRAAPGHELICSDYSAIEAVVLAMLSGEQWRIDVFRTHGMIYEMSAAKITGVPFEEFVRHRKETGDHHPFRKKIGKVAELASGYQGWVNAWKRFGADDHFDNDDAIADAVSKWRRESPQIVKFWRGVEAAAIAAVENPGEYYDYRSIRYACKDDVLYCRLPSGRLLHYHSPRVQWIKKYGKDKKQLSFMGWVNEARKWMRIPTYGGKQTENIVQAVARDIMAAAIVRLEKRGYPVVLHVHDEATAEVPQGFGSIEEFEAIMADHPAWCRDWPVRAAGGWRGLRFRKD